MKKLFENKYIKGTLFLILLLAAVDFIIFGRTPVQEIKTVATVVSSKVANFTSGTSQGQEQVDPNSQAGPVFKLSEQVENFNPQQASLIQFKEWFSQEVKLMSQFNTADEQATKERYLKITAKMNSEQFKVISDMFTSKTQIADEKILSSYLLSMMGYEGVKILGDLATFPIPVQGRPEAHSVDETILTRERAMRVLLINRLYDLALANQGVEAQNAVRELEKVIANLKDSNLKNYAQSKLQEIRSK